MRVEFDAKSVNEGFARVTAAAFITQLDPTLDGECGEPHRPAAVQAGSGNKHDDECAGL